MRHIKGISDEDSLFLLPYAHIESIGVKGDCKSPFILYDIESRKYKKLFF